MLYLSQIFNLDLLQEHPTTRLTSKFVKINHWFECNTISLPFRGTSKICWMFYINKGFPTALHYSFPVRNKKKYKKPAKTSPYQTTGDINFTITSINCTFANFCCCLGCRWGLVIKTSITTSTTSPERRPVAKVLPFARGKPASSQARAGVPVAEQLGK